jgi:signal recognition particle subunit SRP54
MIRSMTPDERARPKKINGQRRRRIADGSGRTVQEVNVLLKQWSEANKMMGKMRQMAGTAANSKQARRQMRSMMRDIGGPAAGRRR